MKALTSKDGHKGELAGKVALVTGGASGIGPAAAAEFPPPGLS